MIKLKKIGILLFFMAISSLPLLAQTGKVRGNVYDQANGQPIPYASIVFRGGTFTGTTTDLNGFYTLDVEAGTYDMTASLVGYDSVSVKISVDAGGIVSQTFQLFETSTALEGVDISARREARKTEVLISKLTVTPAQIKSLPSTGGEPDIAQYLPVLPGIISTGDQGGQIFIRGGSPVMNKILLDGMTIYNPFHSIGFFSVFETEIIRSADVLTGGFGAEYGGRISAIVDLKTREGNKKKFSGMASVSPFMGKFLLEGPLIKLKEENGGSSSFILTAKKSLFDYTSKSIYNYAAPDSLGLPFAFTDLYAKASFVAAGGTKMNLFGFNFNDGVNYSGVADMNWRSTGAGVNFNIVPNSTEMIIGGAANYSNYDLQLTEEGKDPRTTNISNFAVNLDFTFYKNNSELKYGVEASGFGTNLSFKNPFGVTYEQAEYTTELAGFVKYRRTMGKLVIEPSLHVRSYLALGESVFEPRFAAKLNASKNFRIKFAGGLYSQNLISTISNRDIVNLFNGFLSGPEETIKQPGSNAETTSRLQKAFHVVGGVEIDLGSNMELNIEPYLKNFTQLIDINRTKIKLEDPNYIAETGRASGIDFSLRRDTKNRNIWLTYSLGYVNRNDGEQKYPTNQDRRHNVNVVVTQKFGKDFEFGLRWNYGSGFPFTLTQGFYTPFSLNNGIGTNILTGNPSSIGINYSPTRNGGRLPDYHRLDLSLKKVFNFSKTSRLEVNISATNSYNRDNIFYFNRVTYKRVNQLPLLPSLGVAFHF